MADELTLIAGLGNSGVSYAGNRHNAGFLVVDLLADRIGGKFKSHKSRADVIEGRLGGQRVILVKPHGYMNTSGGPISAAANFYKIPPELIVAVHDELDLPFGTLRLKQGGGENGHNGLRSMTQSLATKNYLRLRFGIGRPPGRMDPADYVLRDFSTTERKELPFYLDRAADALENLLVHGLPHTQTHFHSV